MSDVDNNLTIAVLAGTTRPGRQSLNAAKLVAEVGRGFEGIEIVFVDPKEFNFPGDGNDPEGKDPRYTDITVKADAFFIVTPEYNHSFPGSLKRMLDSELKNYVHKPVALAGASNGHWGGLRAVEALVNTVREMGLVVTYSDVYFPNVDKAFVDGKLTPDLVEQYDTSIRAAYAELIWMARALNAARTQS